MSGRYSSDDVDKLPPGSIARLALEYSFASLADMERFHGQA